MKKSIVLLLLLLLAASLAGCAVTIPLDSYSPQNVVRYEHKNAIDIGKFTYEPELYAGLKPNQIQNTAAGDSYASANIADMVRKVTALELEKTGLLLSDHANIVILGDVLELKADDLGYSVDWTYAIRYTIQDRHTDTVLHRREYQPDMKKTGKFGEASVYTSVVHEMVLNGYELFIRDPAVRDLLDIPAVNKRK